jgi:hypothetical protein
MCATDNNAIQIELVLQTKKMFHWLLGRYLFFHPSLRHPLGQRAKLRNTSVCFTAKDLLNVLLP